MKKVLGLIILSAILIIGSVPTLAASPKASTIFMTVLFKNNEIPTDLKNSLSKQNVKIISEIPKLGALEIKGSAELISTLQADSRVESVSPTLKMSLPDKEVKPNEPAQAIPARLGHEPPPEDHSIFNDLQWDIKRVTHNGESFKYEQGNHEVVVGIIDSGIDQNHPDLTKNFLGGKNFVPAGDIDGQDSTETNNPNDIRDRIGHGTYVAGAIAGNGKIMGVAPETGYKVYRVFGEAGQTNTETIAQAIVAATEDNVNVISMSIGGYDVNGQIKWTDPNTGKTYNLGNEVADLKLYKRAVKYAVDHNVTVVASAGNDNIDAGNKKEVTEFLNKEHEGDGYHFVGASVEAPGSLPGVITVSASGPNDSRTTYSNYGAGFVDITAPGGNDVRYPNGFWWEDMCFGATLTNDDGYPPYGYWEGTSMAAPKVSAVAALIIAHNGNAMAPSQVKEKMLQSAEDIGPVGTDKYFGKGMVIAPYQPEALPEHVIWQQSIGGIEDDSASDIIQTKDGGYLSVGATTSFSTGANIDENGIVHPDSDIYVAKIGKDGRTEWTKSLGGQYAEGNGTHALETKDGSYLIQSSSASLNPNGKSEIYLAKLDQSGNILWQKTIGMSNTELYGMAITPGQDGGYVIAGDFVDENDSAPYNFYLTKVDDDGNVIWEHTYGAGNGANDKAQAVIPTNDGGYAITGTSQSTGITSDIAVVKVGHQGQLEWTKTYDGEALDTGYGIKQLADGSYIIVGESQTLEYGEFAAIKIGDIYMSRLDSQGNVIWQKNLGDPNYNESAYGLENTADGNFILVGRKQKQDIPGNISDIYLMKFNAAGDKLSEQVIKGTKGDEGIAIKRIQDGNYILAGRTTTYGNSILDNNMYILKLDRGLLDN